MVGSLYTRNISLIDWARCAAYIDGEGTIQITRMRRSSRQSIPYHVLKLAVTNTDPRIIHWFLGTFGGWAGEHTKTTPKNHKPTYEWRIHSRQAEYILRNCLPYFLAKREQTEIAFSLFATQNWKRRDELGRRAPIPAEVMKQREEIKAKLSAEKRRVIPFSVAS